MPAIPQRLLDNSIALLEKFIFYETAGISLSVAAPQSINIYTIFRTTLTQTIRLHDQMFHLVSNHSLIISLYKLSDSIIKLSDKTLFVSFAL